MSTDESAAKHGRSPTLTAAKLAVLQAMQDQGVTKAELGRRLGWHTPQVDRLFDLDHASRFEQLEAAARVLGRQITIDVVAQTR